MAHGCPGKIAHDGAGQRVATILPSYSHDFTSLACMHYRVPQSVACQLTLAHVYSYRVCSIPPSVNKNLPQQHQAVKSDLCSLQRALSQPSPHSQMMSGSQGGAVATSRQAPTSSLTTLKQATTAARATAGETSFSQAGRISILISTWLSAWTLQQLLTYPGLLVLQMLHGTS